jgi:hypothetical protein
MNKLPKPRPIEFLVRGYDLADALAILERWDSLTVAELAELGFSSSEDSEASGQLSEHPFATFH